MLIAFCVEPILFVCLCPRLQSNNFLLTFTSLLLQAYINRPLLHPPSPADYRSDYCYFCAYSLLSQLPQRDLIISEMARFKLYLFGSHRYRNATSLPAHFSPVSPLREEKEDFFSITQIFSFSSGVGSECGVHL